MSDVSRRTFLQSNAVLLAGLGITTASAGEAGADPVRPQATDLARYRPVTASSTAYAPTPAWFAVDGLAETGVRGSGWRAGGGDPQWIAVDLQAPCTISSVVLVFEATAADPPFTPASGINPFLDTTGWEVLSSCAVAFSLDISADGRTWRTVHEASDSPGGRVEVKLDPPVKARWVRLTGKQQANANPLGVNGFEVYGHADWPRPPATGWTDWGRHYSPPPPLERADDGTVPLESGWSLTMDSRVPGDNGSALAQSGVDTSDWLPATVPGTVHTALVAEGKLPEPTVGLGNMRAPEALSRHSWWYRREFTFPRGFETRRRVWLEFDGIDHHAEVWVDGKSAGTLTHPVARAAFDITEAVQEKEKHAVAVRIDPMPHPGNPGDKGPDGVSTLNSNAEQKDLPGYISISGWDWMPGVRDRGAGIWNHVRLRSTGDIVLGEPRVDTKVPDLSVAEVTLVVPVRNVSSAARTVTVSAELAGARVSRTVDLAAGAAAEVTFLPGQNPSLRIRNPELWWPNGYGEAKLHSLTTAATVDGQLSDRRTVRAGLRQFGYASSQPVLVDPKTSHSAPQTVHFDRTTARYVRIQGGKRATGYGISLWTLSIADNDGPDLAQGKTATASSQDLVFNPPGNAVDGRDNTRWSSNYTDNQWIQVDLGAPVAFDRVVLTWETAYALTFTVQVSADGAKWTDVKHVSNSGIPLQISVNGVRVFCKGGNWGFDELLRRVLPNRMNDTVALHRDMNFTMIRNWVGSSNREEFFAACDENGILVWNDFWAGDALFPPDTKVFLEIAADTVVRYRHHPSIVVWCATNESDPPADMDAGLRKLLGELQPELWYQGNSAGGVATGHGPYSWIDPKRYFDGETYSIGSYGFHSEIGLPTVPVAESMRRLAGDQPSWPIGPAWFHHDWCTRGGQDPETYRAAIEDRYGAGTSLDDFCAKAQLVNYESMRAIFEAYNAALWDDASGVLLWMSHPAHHSTVWQTYDYDLDTNGSFHGARKGCEPVHVQARLSDWQVHAVNQTAQQVDATVHAELFDVRGRPLGPPVTAPVSVAASSVTASFPVPFTDQLPALHLLRLRLTTGDRELSRNVYWRYRTPADARELPKTRTDVWLRPGPVRREGDRDTAVVTMRNTGRFATAGARLSARDAWTDERILPLQCSENYLWLLPGETATVTVSWPSRALRSRRPRFVVEGLNLPRRTT
ncbi:discoidin domain-containing protein [Amycolatopsis jejuensis]|uniref:discoidin domain-containing protein n=1 Tax=Amycolatopsis jejuensis TaxID=330084 RepID=UPI000A61D599|nr:discoidin domain-containing protein [Amycolatopsis jejuensis]